jgi:subfamily B ATP-binding cassette protein HlyB/CyaB
MTITVLYLGVKLVINNQLTIGQLIAFQMFSGQFTGPFLRLVNLWNEFQQALLSGDRLGDILNNPIELKSGKDITLPTLNGSVRFDKVSFRYGLDTPTVLDRVSFEVKPGMSIGLVGRSGSGKSTITKLIEKLYIISEGTIYLDNVDIKHIIRCGSVQHRGGAQTIICSAAPSVKISRSPADAPMELIINVARTAGAHQFQSQLPQGYETLVGERGSTLSGGQKQRFAIARALITNPRILIFDEATSALDYESENIIQQNLAGIKKGRTTFIVAHRLSASKTAIYYCTRRGRIIEMGSHDDLITKKGYYHFLYAQQGNLSG